MPSLVRKVRTSLSIHARRATIGLLDGGYASIHTGRSHDFDDLREYVAGDDVRDIDWKASARHGAPLVKRYVAERRHVIRCVVPTGREMAASTPGGERKADLAVLVCGILGSLALGHGDEVALVSGRGGRVAGSRALATESHLELLLRRIDADPTPAAPPGDVVALLEHVARHERTRSIVLVVADDGVEADRVDPVLRRVRVRHEVLWMTVADVDPSGGRTVRDVARGTLLPDVGSVDPGLVALFEASETERTHRLEQCLRRLGVSSARVTCEDDVVPAVLDLLARHARG